MAYWLKRLARPLLCRVPGRFRPLWLLPGKPRFTFWDAASGLPPGTEVLVAPRTALLDLAWALDRDTAPLPEIHRAIVVRSDRWQGLLTEEDRDLLWDVFGVPVFEQFTAPDGRVVAFECEAHAGLHLAGDPQALAGMPGAIETLPCECGRPESRFMPQPPAEVASAAD